MRARRAALAAALGYMALGGPAAALDATAAKGQAELSIQQAEGGLGSIQAAMARVSRAALTPEKRLAAGELLMRNKDYERAVEVLDQLVELHRQGKAPETVHADALYLLAETYFASEQYLSARRHYREIVEKAPRRPYDTYAGRALGRLVDVSLRSQSYEGLDYVFARLKDMPQSDASGSLQYARGKAYFARGDYASARGALSAVSASSAYAHQAGYLLGVMATKEAAGGPLAGAAKSAAEPAPEQRSGPPDPGRFDAAVEQFQRVTRMNPDSEEHRHVIDLAWMAIGRIHHETDRYLDAAEAYSHVERGSPEFSNMLYELAWVYVRLGDYQRAQRALEVLAITAPERLDFADGSLLRADLMLRSGQFDRALKLYESVREQFDPMRAHVESFLASTTDPAVYYDRLTEEQFVSERSGLPPLVVDWVREAAEDDRVFSVIDDVTRSRDLVRKSRRLVRKLTGVLSSSTRARAFPELKAGLEQTLGLLNQVALARRTLALGLEDVDGARGSGELGEVRAQRRALMDRMSWLPVTPADFSRREADGEQQWNRVSQQIQRLTLEADRLQAIVNGLKRVLEDAERFGATHDPDSKARFTAEIAANERDLAAYFQRIRQYQEAVDIGRAQIGFGDQRYVDDDRVREEFARLLGREVALVAAGHGRGDAAAYARAIQPVLQRADAVEARLRAARADLDARVRGDAGELLDSVRREATSIEQFAGQLDELDQHARLLVGEVAMKNFGLVRDRLKNIVLRADVGIVQQAWELREVQRIRVRNLQRERAREEQNLNDELREVLDDAGDWE